MAAVQETVDRVRSIEVDAYKYGFISPIESDLAPKGLREDTVRFISQKKFEPEWLLDLFPDRITERAGVEWNRSAERVDAVSALLYENLVIEETRSGTPDPEQAAELLSKRALEAGIERFVDPDQLAQFLARAAFASEHASISPLNVDAAFRERLRGLHEELGIPSLPLKPVEPPPKPSRPRKR